MKNLYKIKVKDDSSVSEKTLCILCADVQEIFRLIPANMKVSSVSLEGIYPQNKRIPLKSMKKIVQSIYLMMNSGINLYDCLFMIAVGDEYDKFTRGVVCRSYFHIVRGDDYKKCFELAEYDGYFSLGMGICETRDMFVSNLGSFLSYYTEKEKVQSELKKSLLYPFTVLLSLTVLLFFLRFYIIPSFSSLLNIEINFTVSSVLFVCFFLLLILISVSYVFARKNDSYLCKIPFLGEFYKTIVLYRFVRDINLLISSGLTLYEAMDKTVESIDSVLAKKAFLSPGLDIRSGLDVKEAFCKVKDFKEISLAFALSGKVGGYRQVLDFLQNDCQSRIKESSEKILKMIEPVLIILISVLIMSIAYEVYSKVFIGNINFSVGE